MVSEPIEFFGPKSMEEEEQPLIRMQTELQETKHTRKLRRLKYSCEEIYERMDKGLCIFCDELDTPGHHDLKHKGIQIFIVDDDLASQTQETVTNPEPIVETAKNLDSFIEPLKDDSALQVVGSVSDVLLVHKVDSHVKEVEELPQKSTSGTGENVAHQLFDEKPVRVSNKEVISFLYKDARVWEPGGLPTKMDHWDCLRIDGTLLREWFRRCDEYFDLHKTPPKMRVRVASPHMIASHVRQFDVTTVADVVWIAKHCESSLLQHSSVTQNRAPFNPYQNYNDQPYYEREFGKCPEIEFDRESDKIKDEKLQDKQPEEDVKTLVMSSLLNVLVMSLLMMRNQLGQANSHDGKEFKGVNLGKLLRNEGLLSIVCLFGLNDMSCWTQLLRQQIFPKSWRFKFKTGPRESKLLNNKFFFVEESSGEAILLNTYRAVCLDVYNRNLEADLGIYLYEYKNQMLLLGYHGLEVQVLSCLQEFGEGPKTDTHIVLCWKELASFLWFLHGKKLLDAGQKMQSMLVSDFKTWVPHFGYELRLAGTDPVLGLVWSSFESDMNRLWRCPEAVLSFNSEKMGLDWFFQRDLHKSCLDIRRMIILLCSSADYRKLNLWVDTNYCEIRPDRTHVKLQEMSYFLSEKSLVEFVGYKAHGRDLLVVGVKQFTLAATKFHLKHKWKSRLIQAFFGLQFVVDNIVLTSPVKVAYSVLGLEVFVENVVLFTGHDKLLFSNNHKLLHLEIGFCTQYNGLELLSTEHQSSPGLDYFTYLNFIWKQVLSCGCEAGHISSRIVFVGGIHGLEAQRKRLLVLNEISLLDNDNKVDFTTEASWFYNKPMIREVFHLQRPPELIYLQGNPNFITKVLVQWKEHPPDQFFSGFYGQVLMLSSLRTRMFEEGSIVTGLSDSERRLLSFGLLMLVKLWFTYVFWFSKLYMYA